VSSGTAVQLSSSAAIQVFAFVFLHNRRRSSVRSVAVVVATAAVVVVDRAYIEEPSTPPSRGRRELGRRRLLVFLNEVFPEPVAFDGCRWRRWRRRLRRRWWFHLCPATWSGRIVVRRRQWWVVLAAVAVKEEWQPRWRWRRLVSSNCSRGPQLSSTVTETMVEMEDSMDSGAVKSLFGRGHTHEFLKKKHSD